MIRILGSPKHLCDGITRRDWLMASSLSLGISANPLKAAAPAVRQRGFGAARNVILLYPFGGPSHIDTFDTKPDAPAEIRGSFKTIQSRLPGCNISEYLPLTAGIMDRVTVLRSLTHPWNFHGMQWATTGLPAGSIPHEETQFRPDHWPFVGSVVHRLSQHKQSGIPNNVMLPWMLSKNRTKIFPMRAPMPPGLAVPTSLCGVNSPARLRAKSCALLTALLNRYATLTLASLHLVGFRLPRIQSCLLK